jgi:HAD superfamily hydrolase (TIGR01490 family)
MDLVLFDLDNTLIAGDSDYEWARFLIDKGVLDGVVYEARNEEFFAQYKAGSLDILEFLAFQLHPLASHPREQLQRWHAEFMQSRILPLIGAKARALVDGHLAEGSLCAIVTATNAFITGPIARELGIAHLVATELEEIDGRYTGKPRGTPCFREGKLARVDQWLAGLGHAWGSFQGTCFYSDSLNDLPMLERVSRPVAVDPDDTLRRIAAERGWPVISLNRPDGTGDGNEGSAL